MTIYRGYEIKKSQIHALRDEYVIWLEGMEQHREMSEEACLTWIDREKKKQMQQKGA